MLDIQTISCGISPGPLDGSQCRTGNKFGCFFGVGLKMKPAVDRGDGVQVNLYITHPPLVFVGACLEQWTPRDDRERKEPEKKKRRRRRRRRR